MKKYLLSFLFITASIFAISQCTADYDFGDAEYGIYPDPEMGETLDEAYLDEDYSDIIHVLVPIDAGAITPIADGMTVDSIMLNAVSILMNDEWTSISTLGLDIECNNNGDSPTSCMFHGGNQYCATVSGVPNAVGSFPMRIEVTIYAETILGPVELPFEYEGEDFNFIVNGEVNVTEMNNAIEVLPLSPNPFSDISSIKFIAPNNARTTLTVRNLLGAEVYSQTRTSARGLNEIIFDGSSLDAGIYLYTLSVGTYTTTHRMIIQR